MDVETSAWARTRPICGLPSGSAIWHDAAMVWRGRHVVVTGGSSGIDEAVALAAVRRGASVTLMARSQARLAEAAARLRTSCSRR